MVDCLMVKCLIDPETVDDQKIELSAVDPITNALASIQPRCSTYPKEIQAQHCFLTLWSQKRSSIWNLTFKWVTDLKMFRKSSIHALF